jgi:hypothetical protein
MTRPARFPCVAGSLATAAALLLAACGGGASDAPPVGATPLAKEALVATDAAGLTEHFRARLAAVRSTVADGGVRWAFVPTLVAGGPGGVPVGTVSPVAQATTDVDAGTASPVMQEAGVDEDDVVKDDAGAVYALTPPDPAGMAVQSVVIHGAVTGGAAQAPLAVVPLDRSVRYTGLVLDAPRRRLVAVGVADPGPWMPQPVDPIAAVTVPPDRARPSVETSSLAFVDVSVPASPVRVATLSLDGTIQVTRASGGRMWLVVRNQPRFDGFDWSATPAADAANAGWLARFSATDVLPTWRVDGQPQGPLVTGDACHVQPSSPGGVAAMTTVLSIDLAAPTDPPRSRCVAAPVDVVYMTQGALYLGTLRYPEQPAREPGAAVPTFVPARPATDVHKFVLDAGTAVYRGSGSAPGRLSWGSDTARFMLSASGTDLRVVTQLDPGTDTGPARLSVLRDDGAGALRTLSTLPNAQRPEPIGKTGEQVHAVRFVGDRAYVVTFRRTDPVYAIDLADPADPRLLGALEVPGFSDRLVPLTPELLLGVGHATQAFNGVDLPSGVLVSLLDVRDPVRPREIARRVVGGAGSLSASDFSPHGVAVRRVGERFRIGLPVTVQGQDPAVPDTGTRSSPVHSRLAALRFEIDPAAPALAERAPVIAPDLRTESGWRSGTGMPFDRALHVGDETWLWYDGRFTAAAW